MRQASPIFATLHARLHAVEINLDSKLLVVPDSRTVPSLRRGLKLVSARVLLPNPSHHHHQQHKKVHAKLGSKEKWLQGTRRLWEVPRCAAQRAAVAAVELAVQAALEARATVVWEMATSTASLQTGKAALIMLLHAL
jgi:hypothetical protein